MKGESQSRQGQQPGPAAVPGDKCETLFYHFQLENYITGFSGADWGYREGDLEDGQTPSSVTSFLEQH